MASNAVTPSSGRRCRPYRRAVEVKSAAFRWAVANPMKAVLQDSVKAASRVETGESPSAL